MKSLVFVALLLTATGTLAADKFTLHVTSTRIQDLQETCTDPKTHEATCVMTKVFVTGRSAQAVYELECVEIMIITPKRYAVACPRVRAGHEYLVEYYNETALCFDPAAAPAPEADHVSCYGIQSESEIERGKEHK